MSPELIPERSWDNGPRYALVWDHDGTEWAVRCQPAEAGAPIWGFGPTVEAALQDLDGAHKALLDFLAESEEHVLPAETVS